jgi:hypothetical protein
MRNYTSISQIKGKRNIFIAAFKEFRRFPPTTKMTSISRSARYVYCEGFN